MENSNILPRVLIIVPSLQSGGAELFLTRLIKELQDSVEILLVVMKTFEDEIDISNLNKIQLARLNMNRFKGGVSILSSIFRFVKLVHGFKPIAIQCFLYPAELLSLILFKKYRIFWSLRGTGNPKERNLFKRFAMFFDVVMSKRYPLKIVACSSAAAEWAISLGIDKSKIKVINNFLDDWTHNVSSQSILQSDRPNLRLTGIRVGMAARVDILKGHEILVEALSDFCKDTRIPITLTLIGRGTDNLIFSSNLVHYSNSSDNLLHLEYLGEILDSKSKAKWFSELDLYVMASFKEGFPNSLAEAVAIGCPAIATSSGNASEILPARLIVPRVDSQTISFTIKSLLDMPSNEFSKCIDISRKNILTLADKKSVCFAYFNLWTLY